MSPTRILLTSLIASATLLASGAAMAEDLIYRPIIPAFGGNPNNYDYLIGLAQLQNQHPADGGGGGGGGAPEITFPPIVIDLGGLGNTPSVPDDNFQTDNGASQ